MPKSESVGLGCSLGWTPVLCVTHITVKAACGCESLLLLVFVWSAHLLIRLIRLLRQRCCQSATRELMMIFVNFSSMWADIVYWLLVSILYRVDHRVNIDQFPNLLICALTYSYVHKMSEHCNTRQHATRCQQQTLMNRRLDDAASSSNFSYLEVIL